MRLAPALLTALLTAPACSGGDSKAPAEGTTPAEAPAEKQVGPSILLITLDTTRADRLGPYHYKLADTPTYDALAEQGTVWERAYSTCPLTIPSHSTIFTGRAPPTHGVRDNGDFILSEDEVLISERLGEAGWVTAAFTSAFPTQRRWGFNQGFDLYHDPLQRQPTQLDWRDERRADEVVDDAIEALSAIRAGTGLSEVDGTPLAADAPLFVWVHLFDAHWPYEPPEPFKSQHEGRPYDGEIAYTDSQVARLMEWWNANNERSTVLITSDHGEGLGDGGEQTHGFLLHDGTIRVPMIMAGEGIDAGKRLEDPVGHTDIVPTLLNIAGLPLDDLLQGRDMREGGSERLYSEALTGQFNLGLAPLHAYTDGEGRFMDGGWGGWYPTILDRVAFIKDDSADVDAKRAVLAEMMAEITVEEATEAASTATLDAEDLERLQALGYIGGDLTAEAGEVDPRDVIDIIPLTWQVRQMMGARRIQLAEKALEKLEERLPNTFGVDLLRAQLTRGQGRIAEAREQFVALFLRSPSSTLAMNVADISMANANWREARSWYEEALRMQPASPEAMGGIVRTTLALGERELAEELADKYLLKYPDHAHLLLARASISLSRGDAESALRDAQAAEVELPYASWVTVVTAEALWALGRSEEAIARLDTAQRLDPTDTAIRMQLSRCLLLVGRNAEAARLMAPAGRLLPDVQEVQHLDQLAQDALQAEREGVPLEFDEVERRIGGLGAATLIGDGEDGDAADTGGKDAGDDELKPEELIGGE